MATEDGSVSLMVSGVLDKKEVQQWIKENELPNKVKAFLNKTLKDAKARKPTREESDQGRDKCARRFLILEHSARCFPSNQLPTVAKCEAQFNSPSLVP